VPLRRRAYLEPPAHPAVLADPDPVDLAPDPVVPDPGSAGRELPARSDRPLHACR
jgi:hypothetical protein